MSRKTDERRAALRARLVDAGEAQIVAAGYESIRARDLAAAAGCAVGAIYTIYGDLSELVMEVNGRTFRRLGDFVSQEVARHGARDDPMEQMVVMGRAYLDFAAENTNAWRALFHVEMSGEARVPDWYLDELRSLFGQIAQPLSQLHPDADRDHIMLLTRTLFSSVHGIVLLGLEQRISAVPVPAMQAMIDVVIRKVAK